MIRNAFAYATRKKLKSLIIILIIGFMAGVYSYPGV